MIREMGRGKAGLFPRETKRGVETPWGFLFPAQRPNQAAHRGRREHGYQGSEEPGLFSLSVDWGGPGASRAQDGTWVEEGVGLIPIRRGRP